MSNDLTAVTTLPQDMTGNDADAQSPEGYGFDVSLSDPLANTSDDGQDAGPSLNELAPMPEASAQPSFCGLVGPDMCPKKEDCHQDALSDTSTTLCSVAFKLIASFNHQKLSMSEIVSELRMGFRKCNDDDGDACRVENKLLYSLLYRIVD